MRPQIGCDAGPTVARRTARRSWIYDNQGKGIVPRGSVACLQGAYCGVPLKPAQARPALFHGRQELSHGVRKFVTC
jgi:hypothetical protein